MPRRMGTMVTALLCLAILAACVDLGASNRQANAQTTTDWDPGDYASNSSVQYAAALLVRNTLTLRGDETVLDIGSGDGRITAEMSRELPRGRIVGVDASQKNVDFARATYPPAQYPNLSFEVQNAQNLPYDTQFDIVVSFSTLHWVTDLGAALKGIRKALKPGGTFAMSAVRGLYAPMEEVTDELIRSAKWGRYLASFSTGLNFVQRDRYVALLAQHDFKPATVDNVSLYVFFPNRDKFKMWVEQWYMYRNAVPPALKDEFLYEAVDRYLIKQPMDAQGLIFVVSRRVQVKAVKPASAASGKD